LEAALRIEPQHRAALMSLAASREQHGHYSEAAETLRALVRSYPQDREARLRWAVNLERLNQRSKAEELYTQLASAGVGDWIELVAIDQLAAMQATRGDLDQAEVTLRSAIEHWPNEPTLSIQLAWVLDEAHQLQSASELVERLVSSSASTRQSPRYRYNHWHIHIFDESRLTLSKLIREYADEADARWLMREGAEE
jgi:tetratricopeptide (TPR) repeat protein